MSDNDGLPDDLETGELLLTFHLCNAITTSVDDDVSLNAKAALPALMVLERDYPRHALCANTPPLALRSQIYALVRNRTRVDRMLAGEQPRCTFVFISYFL